jgi:hypothetical protein
MRHLKQSGSPEGSRLACHDAAPALITLCCAMAAAADLAATSPCICASRSLNARQQVGPATASVSSQSPAQRGPRLRLQLEQFPGKQLILVRYAPDHNPIDEWVYNAAEIDASKVIWAREMTPQR